MMTHMKQQRPFVVGKMAVFLLGSALWVAGCSGLAGDTNMRRGADAESTPVAVTRPVASEDLKLVTG